MFEFRFFEIWREPDYIDRLINGVLLSVELSTVGGILGLFLGLVLAALKTQNTPLIIRYLSLS